MSRWRCFYSSLLTPNPYSCASLTVSRRMPSFVKKFKNSFQLTLSEFRWSSDEISLVIAGWSILIFSDNIFISSSTCIPSHLLTVDFPDLFLGLNSGKCLFISVSSSWVKSKGCSFYLGKFLNCLKSSSICCIILAFDDIFSVLFITALLWTLFGDLWLDLSDDIVLFKIRSVSDGFFCLPF